MRGEGIRETKEKISKLRPDNGIVNLTPQETQLPAQAKWIRCLFWSSDRLEVNRVFPYSNLDCMISR
jgi:hypothetical protein